MVSVSALRDRDDYIFVTEGKFQHSPTRQEYSFFFLVSSPRFGSYVGSSRYSWLGDLKYLGVQSRKQVSAIELALKNTLC